MQKPIGKGKSLFSVPAVLISTVSSLYYFDTFFFDSNRKSRHILFPRHQLKKGISPWTNLF